MMLIMTMKVCDNSLATAGALDDDDDDGDGDDK